MDPVSVTIITTFTTSWGVYAVGEIKTPGFTPGAEFSSDAVYTWDDPAHHRKGQADASGRGVVDADGNAVYYCVLGPVPGGKLSGTVKEYSVSFDQVVTW